MPRFWRRFQIWMARPFEPCEAERGGAEHNAMRHVESLRDHPFGLSR